MIETLSIEDIIYCYEEGVHVKLYSHLPRSLDIEQLKAYHQRGSYDPGEKKVAIYLSHITDLADYKTTLFHELAHAIDDLLFDEASSEEQIEQIGLQTYQQNPQLYDFIKGIFKLPNTRFERIE